MVVWRTGKVYLEGGVQERVAEECEDGTGNGEGSIRQQLKTMQLKLDATRKQKNAHNAGRKTVEDRTLAEASGMFYGSWRNRPPTIPQMGHVRERFQSGKPRPRIGGPHRNYDK